MPEITLYLLGGFRMVREGRGEMTVPGRKAQALLAYLALNPGRSLPREKLASLLWGERFDEQARHSLRQCLLTLRKALGAEDDSVLVADGDSVRLETGKIATDVEDFERLATDGTRDALERAVALYQGDLLEGVGIRSEGFDEWHGVESARIRDLAADAMARLAALLADSGAYDDAVEMAQRVLRVDPLREDAHRALMRAYQRTGRRVAALKQYEDCVSILREQLDVGPEGETLRLYEDIRSESEGAEVANASTPVVQARNESSLRRKWIWVAVVALIALAGGISWRFLPGPPPSGELLARQESMAFPLPDRPSIAVLPFEDLSGNASQDPFIYGITEDITTALSMSSEMFVIARHAAMAYQGKHVTVKQVAEELGVRYVLEGSVQRSGDRARINVRLVDALDGRQIWADRYDREMQDIFALQDEITLQIITSLQVKMTEGEQDRIALIHGTKNLQAWILSSQGTQRTRRLTRQDNAAARELFRMAAELDPKYPGPWDGQSWTHLIDAKFGWGESPEASLRAAAEFAQKAYSLDRERPRTYGLLGSIELLRGNHEQAILFGEKAIMLDPNGAEVTALLALTLAYTGDLERSAALLDRAMRLSPYYPDWYRWTLGRVYRLMGRYEEAIAALQIRTRSGPDSLVPLVELVATYSQAGRLADAEAAAAEVLRIDPKFSVSAWTSVPPYKSPSVSQREFDALRRAGLPE